MAVVSSKITPSPQIKRCLDWLSESIICKIFLGNKLSERVLDRALSVSLMLNIVMVVMVDRGGWWWSFRWRRRRCSTWLMFGLLTVTVSCGQQKLICIEVCYLHTPVSPNLGLLLYDRADSGGSADISPHKTQTVRPECAHPQPGWKYRTDWRFLIKIWLSVFRLSSSP